MLTKSDAEELRQIGERVEALAGRLAGEMKTLSGKNARECARAYENLSEVGWRLDSAVNSLNGIAERQEQRGIEVQDASK